MMIIACGVYNVLDPAVLLPKVHAKDVLEHPEAMLREENGEEVEVKSQIEGESSSGRTSE